MAEGSLRCVRFILRLSNGLADRFIESRKYITPTNETGALRQRRVWFSIGLPGKHEPTGKADFFRCAFPYQTPEENYVFKDSEECHTYKSTVRSASRKKLDNKDNEKPGHEKPGNHLGRDFYHSGRNQSFVRSHKI